MKDDTTKLNDAKKAYDNAKKNLNDYVGAGNRDTTDQTFKKLSQASLNATYDLGYAQGKVDADNQTIGSLTQTLQLTQKLAQTAADEIAATEAAIDALMTQISAYLVDGCYVDPDIL